MERSYMLAKIDIQEAIADWLNKKEGTDFKITDVKLFHSNASQDGIYFQPEIYGAEVSHND